MLIVDAQVHAWSQGQSTGHHRRMPITAAVLEAEMRVAGVDAAVLVPPLWDPSGNRYSLELARARPDAFAVMGLLDVEPGAGGGDVPGRLARWRDEPGMRAIRFLFNSVERRAPLDDGRLDGAWAAAEAAGLCVALLVPGALDVADRIAAAHPRLPIVVDHLGVPRGASGPMAFDHLPQLLALARHPQVHVKAAGVGDYALDPYPFKSLDATLRRVYDAFGPERIVWASELSRLHHGYRQCVTHFCETLAWLTGRELELVMGGNICRLLDWHPCAGAARAAAGAAAGP